VWGRQIPAEASLAEGCLPLGLASEVRLLNDMAAGQKLRWQDVALDPKDPAVQVRRAMEAAFGRQQRKKEPVPD
jgi:predicted homoserine dehydrogenase-like protein